MNISGPGKSRATVFFCKQKLVLLMHSRILNKKALEVGTDVIYTSNAFLKFIEYGMTRRMDALLYQRI